LMTIQMNTTKAMKPKIAMPMRMASASLPLM
jgi:hypothetical protein